MARDLTTNTKNQSLAASCTPVFFALFDFQSGAVRVWSGIGTKSWGGNDYTGLGHLGTVAPIEETADVRANGVSFQLSGVPSALIATVLGDNYQGRTVKLWLGFLDSADAIIADPYLIFAGRMDNVEIDEGPETAVIRVQAESRLIDLQRSRERRYTHEDQQIDFPGDLGLEYMATAQSTPFMWGGQRVPTYGSGGNTGGGGGDRGRGMEAQ
jgi:hypothetical protein